LQANVKVKILSKWPVITMCISLVYIYPPYLYNGIWVSGELTKTILPNTVTTATLHLYTITANTNGTGFYSFLVSFYGAEKI